MWKGSYAGLVATATVVLGITLSCVCYRPVQADERTKRGINSLFTAEPVIGGTVSSALEAYRTAKEMFYSKIYVEIVNYSKWALSQPEYELSGGVTTQLPTIVHPGYKEAFVGEQVLGDAGTEGVVAWDIAEDYFCAIYWRVHQDIAWRDDNQLGIGCTTHTQHENVTDIGDLDNIDYITYQLYGDSQKTLQHCEDHFCLQAIMSSSHKSEATVNFIPRKDYDLAPSMQADDSDVDRSGVDRSGVDRGGTDRSGTYRSGTDRSGIDQGMIEEILDNSNSCKLGCSSAPIVATNPVGIGLFVTISLYISLQ